MHFMWSSVNVRYFGRQWQSQDFSSEGSKLKNNVKQKLIKKKMLFEFGIYHSNRKFYFKH
jgi:hypothetical protein